MSYFEFNGNGKLLKNKGVLTGEFRGKQDDQLNKEGMNKTFPSLCVELTESETQPTDL